jgi:murein DD-endopeptidase MepM/ murein hydrolase activator NlpD
MVEHEPIWAARPVVPNAVTVKGSTYVVQPGETLGGVGNRSGAGPDAIARANGLTPPFVLLPGQRLTIPGGRYHPVAEGETGIAIAIAYGVEWRRVVAFNGLREPYALRRGQRLLLPPDASTQPVSPTTLEARAAAFRIDIDDVLTGGQPAAADNKRIAAAPRQASPLPRDMPIAQPGAFYGTFAWPLTGTVLSRFGPGASGQRNNGIDIAAARGTPIRASAGGVVAYAGDRVGQFGGLVLLTHGSGWVTAYAHAGRVDVVRGQRVEKGQVIGVSGDTGYADRPELHFEIRKDRTPVNPLAQLPPR